MTDKLIISDTHYHNFGRFSTTDSDGVNSRLKQIVAATQEAFDAAKAAGVKTVLHAGDCFHVRGKISPTVLNPVLELYKQAVADGLDVYMIAGNHDLESRESSELTNTASALSAVGVTVINETTIVEDIKCVFVPWHSSLSELKQQLSDSAAKINAEDYTAVIHAPMNGVIAGIPDHGLEASELAKFGYKRIYCGHYHNHIDFGSVVSIGSLTHQTFGDIHSKAGYVIEQNDKLTHFETSAPKFVDLDVEAPETQDEFEDAVRGNFVRARLEDATESDLATLRSELEKAGALGSTVTNVPTKSNTTARTGVSTAKSGATIESSVSAWMKSRGFAQHSAEIEKAAINILSEI